MEIRGLKDEEARDKLKARYILYMPFLRSLFAMHTKGSNNS